MFQPWRSSDLNRSFVRPSWLKPLLLYPLLQELLIHNFQTGVLLLQGALLYSLALLCGGLFVSVSSVPNPNCCSLEVWVCLIWGSSWRKGARNTAWCALLPRSLQWMAQQEWTTSLWSAKYVSRAHGIGIISGQLGQRAAGSMFCALG